MTRYLVLKQLVIRVYVLKWAVVMIGLEVNGKPLMRAYSIASANYEEELEFFSIKVQDGPLTSILQKVQVGDEILVSRKPTGTLVLDDLLPGKIYGYFPQELA